jgi:ElaB/YqjD/DUF883 family membrane-anchored ribosome-binding protein
MGHSKIFGGQRMDTATLDIAKEEPYAEVQAAREASRQARAAVRQEVSILIAEVEKLLRCMRAAADPEVARVRAEVESAVAATRRALVTRVDQVRRQASDTVEASDRYVREQPWRALGLAAAAGVVIGLLLGRQRMNGL